MSHCQNKLRVAVAVTALDRLQRKEFGRVEDVLFAGGIMRGKLLFHRFLKVGYGLAARLHRGVLRHDVTNGLRHVKKLLGIGVHGGHVAFGAGGVAAQHGHLLEHDHLGVALDGGGCCHHAGSAAAHNDDIGLCFKRQGLL